MVDGRRMSISLKESDDETDFSEDSELVSSSNSDSEESNDNSELRFENDECQENEDGEDPIIKNIRERQNQATSQPTSITSEDPFVSFCLHPSEDIICMGCISGNVCIYSYSINENKLLGEIEAHLKTCRIVEFSKDGQTIFSGGRDKVIAFVDINVSDIKLFIDCAHECPISTLSVIDEKLIVSGGDDGVIKIWDTRYINKPTLMYREMNDYVSDIVVKDSHKVACTSGDGTLTCFDIRSAKKIGQTEPYRSDLTSCCSAHGETMIVCGSLTGEFLFYKWNDFSEMSGMYKSGKRDINALIAISDNIVLAGLDDGNVKSYHFFPHKEIGVVGQHSLNIECLDMSHDGSLVASLSPDPVVKFWNVSYFEGFELNIDITKEVKGEVNLPSSEFEDKKNFFSDLV